MTRYETLGHYLRGCGARPLELSFRRIEEILGRSLPASARRHQAWWANTRTHSHAEAWMAVGWKTGRVDLAGETVGFERGRADEPAPAFRGSSGAGEDDDLRLARAQLSPAARRLIKDFADERGGTLAEAVAAVVNAVAAERRRQLGQQFTGEDAEDGG